MSSHALLKKIREGERAKKAKRKRGEGYWLKRLLFPGFFIFPLFDDGSRCIHHFWPQTVRFNLHSILSNKINQRHKRDPVPPVAVGEAEAITQAMKRKYLNTFRGSTFTGKGPQERVYW